MEPSVLSGNRFKLIFFGGKGGVGKTSCAVATAISLSQKFRTLLVSTDPAHSVSDSLEQQLSTEIQEVKNVENLSAIEIAADKAFENFKQQYHKELNVFWKTSLGFDNEDVEQLLGLSVPGIDEIMSLKVIMEIIEKHEFERYIVDMAPTGHALRLLASPHVLEQWIKVAAQIRWKYRYMLTRFSGGYLPDSTDDMLLNLKKTTRHIRELLCNNSACEFIAVCIPEAMAVRETFRLLATLQENKMPVQQIIINQVMSYGTCSFCLRKKEVQQKYIKQVEETCRDCIEIRKVPSFPEEIKGIEKLNMLRETLWDCRKIK